MPRLAEYHMRELAETSWESVRRSTREREFHHRPEEAMAWLMVRGARQEDIQILRMAGSRVRVARKPMKRYLATAHRAGFEKIGKAIDAVQIDISLREREDARVTVEFSILELQALWKFFKRYS